MNILALETSTDACSVAFRVADGEIFSEFRVAPRQHTYYLPRMMDSVLQQAGVEKSSIHAIAYANGPGAFTGVRIATATAQGLAIGLDLDLIPVSTLAVLAQQACNEFNIDSMRVALDARMGEAYTAEYTQNPSSGLVELVGEELLLTLEKLPVSSHACGVGSGFRARREAGFEDGENQRLYEDVYPSAAALVKLATQLHWENKYFSADQVSINYLRNRVAQKKKTG